MLCTVRSLGSITDSGYTLFCSVGFKSWDIDFLFPLGSLCFLMPLSTHSVAVQDKSGQFSLAKDRRVFS